MYEDELDVDDGLDAAMLEQEAASGIQTLDELQSRATELVRLRAERDATKDKAEKAKREFDEFQAEFLNDLSASPLRGTINIALNNDKEVQIIPKATKGARILDKDALRKYMAERSKEDQYFKDDVRKAELNKLVNDCLEQKKPLPPGLDYYTTEYFTISFKD